VKEELSKIEVGCVDQLKQLKDEQDVLEGRIKAMDDMKSSVAEAVYLRVRSDYAAKRDALETQAKPLREQTREQYAKLAKLSESLEAELERITLDGQEVELRHQLGEYDKKEYDKRTKAIESATAEKAEWRKAADELKVRFLGAVRAEHELLGNAPPPAAASYVTGETVVPAKRPDITNEFAAPEFGRAAVPAASATASIPVGGTMVMPAINIPPPPSFAAGSTVVMGAVRPAASSGPVSDSTVMFKPARLVPQNPEAGKSTYTLGLKALAVGSDGGSDIRIGGPGVDPRHAQITPTPAGYVIKDFDTKHGTRVNAEKVRERLLANEDIVQVGAARFVFRAS
jgi:hypothetical protein